MKKGNFVELWYGQILSNKGSGQDFLPLLNKYEREKLANYTRQDLQQKYINVRGILRIILAPYLNCMPQQIIIKTGKYGKPFVSDKSDEPVQFNLSHTGNEFAIVVSNCSEVGVDIEQCKKRKSLQALVEKCFSDQEANYWNALPEEQKTGMFFRFWVRKEAFVKAVGRGIGLGLNQCSINPEKLNSFTLIPEDYGLASDWKITNVPLDNDKVCAIVSKNIKFNYKQMEWN